MATIEDVRQAALGLPETSERISWGTPAFFAGKILFVRVKEDFESIALKMTFDEREIRMAMEPELFFITPHYLNSPMVLVRLGQLELPLLDELLQTAWRIAATKRMLKEHTPASG